MFRKVVLFSFLCSFCLVACRHYDDDDDDPVPYNFGYAVRDEDGAHFRKEELDEFGTVKGSYGFIDENGFQRIVYYEADDNGFRAHIKTNEPGTISGSTADANFHSSYRHRDEIIHQYRNNF